MKKLLYCAAALAMAIFAGSCQQEKLEPVAGNGTVTFTVEAPANVQTKAIADGLNVNELVYEVWLTNELGKLTQNAQKLYQATTTMAEENGVNKASITLDLVNDQKFTVLFWAQVQGTGVYNTQELTAVHYANTAAEAYAANDERLAAFYAVAYVNDCRHVKKDGTPTGSEVTLRRPFAQLNLATLNTSTAYDVALVSSKVKVTNANTEFNVATSVASEPKVIEFLEYKVPADPSTLEVNDVVYEYAGMNYLFAGDNATVEYDITTKITGVGGSEMSGNVNNIVSSVPLKENYRTNIIGNLLTSKVDYQIVVDADWAQEYDEPINISVWDGSSVSEPENDGDIYTIDNSSELAWLAAAVNGTLQQTKAEETAPQTFAGKTFVLNTDVDIDGQEWTPIGNSTTNFKGTFDGNGFTVKNLVVNGGSASNKGLFGVTSDGEVKNLTVENAKVSGRLNVGVVAGTPYTSKYTNITVKGHVEVNGMAYVGGVGGKNAYADWTDITVDVDETSYVNANSIENGTAYRTYVGGVVGFNGEGSHTFSNITSNIDVIGSTCDVGGLFGIAHYGNNFVNCTCSGDVTITDAAEAGDAEEIGGIAGVWHNETGYTVTFDGCGFEGTLSVNITEGVDLIDNDIVGKAYKADGQGTLVIKNSNSVIWVSDAEELQNAAENANNGTTVIKFLNDITGNATIPQTEDRNIVINGNGKKYDGTISIDGNSRHTAAETLVIKNINFEHSGSAIYFIEQNSAAEAVRYPHNVTVEECTFKGDGSSTICGIRFRQAYNVTVKNCTAEGMFFFMWTTGGNKILVDNVDVVDSYLEGGFSLGPCNEITVKNSKIVATNSSYPYSYGIRFDGDHAYTATVSDNDITAAVPVILRKTTAAQTLNLSENTLNTTKDYQLIVCENDYKADVALVEPTVEYVVTGAEGLVAFPVRVLHEESGLIWNGSNAKKFWITNAEQLYNAVSYFNGQTHSNEGNIVTLELDADIDLAGQDWTPWNVMFVNVNANGHKISNLNNNFFGYAGAVTLNDLTLENVVAAGNQAGTFAASTEGTTFNNCLLSGANKVTYVDADKNENGIGVISGITINANLNVEVVAGAKVTLEYNDIQDTEKTTFSSYLNGYKHTTYDVNKGVITVNGTLEIGGISYEKEVAANGDIAVTLTSDGTATKTRRSIVEEDARIKSAVVEEGITIIGNRTFRKCYGLETVTLPSTLTEIEQAAFQSCNNLKSVVIPASVNVIGEGAFAECGALTSINIPEGVTRIEKDALRAIGVEELTIPSTVTFIGSYAFRDTYKMKKMYIMSETLESVASDAFLWAAPPKGATMTIYVKNQTVKDQILSALGNNPSKFTVEIM